MPERHEYSGAIFFTADDPHYRVCPSGLAGRAADL